MGRYTGKTCRLSVMLSLTASFFLVEIVVGYVTNSIALVADSFHMLSDVVALIVGFASVRISKWPSKRNTYGWVRAEILGALVNAVFLLALCFSILVEALKRLVEVEKVDNPKLLLIVGAVGLLVNVIGLVLFGGHGHSHGGGHGHSHGGGHGHSHGGKQMMESSVDPELGPLKSQLANGHAAEGGENDQSVLSTDSATESNDTEVYLSPSTNITIEIKKQKINQPSQWNMPRVNEPRTTKRSQSSQLNMRGVFLHVLGDALGSVVVIVSALVIMFADGDWRYYVDPGMSVMMVFIILSTTIPLLKESAFILLQTVPSHVDVENIITELEQMEGIYGVHECHIWQLAGNRIVASAHIRCHGIDEYMTLAAKIKELFHKSGIHSTTIQPEFIDYNNSPSNLSDCALLCKSGDEPRCQPDTCCGDRVNWLSRRLNTNTRGSEDEAMQQMNRNGNNSTVMSSESMNFSNTRSLDMKFSPDGDEVVFEMTHIPQGADGSQGYHIASPKTPESESGSTTQPLIAGSNHNERQPHRGS